MIDDTSDRMSTFSNALKDNQNSNVTDSAACYLLLLGVGVGASLTWAIAQNFIWSWLGQEQNKGNLSSSYEERKRERLPDLVILVRHGESEGNVDKTLWWKVPDNKIRLTEKGRLQAMQVGERIERVLQHYESNLGICMQRLHIHASPFERTIETARLARKSIEHRVARHNMCPRLREQEFGNMQSADFKAYREEQKYVGRFWYRFPTGESGADGVLVCHYVTAECILIVSSSFTFPFPPLVHSVFDRVKSWWEDSLLMTNERWGYERINAAVVFSHGLTMRCCLMQLYSWSPTTFHTVYNVANCGIYILRMDLSIPGASPYVLDGINGDVPESSIDVLTTFQCYGTSDEGPKMAQKIFKLRDYLNIPPPRMTRIDIVKEKLVEQYPDEIQRIEDIESIRFMPFTQRRARNSVVATPEQLTLQTRTSIPEEDVENRVNALSQESTGRQPHAVPEASHRWPLFTTS
jgi:broad specificity phosphatase PhoE